MRNAGIGLLLFTWGSLMAFSGSKLGVLWGGLVNAVAMYMFTRVASSQESD